MRRIRLCSAGSETTDIQEHDCDYLFAPADAEPAREDLLCCFLSDMRAEDPAETFLFAQLGNHVVELTEQSAEFIGSARR